MSQYLYSERHDEYYPKPGTAAWRKEECGNYDCSVCGLDDINPHAIEPHEVDGDTVCRDCVASCVLCGEFVDDDNLDDFGPAVRYRRRDGMLSDATHATCAASWLLGAWAGVEEYGFESEGREEIAAIVAAAVSEAA